MRILIIALLAAVVFAPIGLMLALGFKKRFERSVFSRIYAWESPWSLVTQDRKVIEAYEQMRQRIAIMLVVLVLLFAVVVYALASIQF
ncbi:MAG: hypothetical protein Rhims3KO_17360 [Hyphomicrobiales bacterium]